MSSQKPNLVKLYDQNYKEIEAYLDSTVYTREEKVELILTKNKNEPPLSKESNSFLAMCLYHYRECGYVPLNLSLKAMRLLGENLGLPHYLNHVKKMMTGGRPMEETVRLLEVVAEELDDFKHTEAMASLLVHAVLCKCVSLVHVLLKSKSGRQAVMVRVGVISKHCFDATKSTTAIQQCDEEKYQSFQPLDKNKWTFHRATILEIAIHKKANKEIVQELVAAGGKNLISLSKRSLLQGAILECNNQDAFEIMKLMLRVGGKDLIMVDKSWKVDDKKTVNIFEFLSIYQRLLFDHECDDDHALNRVYKIMDLLIKHGGKDAILQKNTSGGSILHYFPYFGHARFIDIVERIVKIGGMELLCVQDKHGDSILHVLAKCQQKVSSFYWELLIKKELVMVQNNKGQTALHLAYANNATFGIDVMLAQGGKDLAWIQDNEGNTALHYLQQDGGNFASLKLIIRVGGMDILHCCNHKQKKALSPFLIQALEFQHDKKKLQASVTKYEKKVDDFKHKHAKDTSRMEELKEIEKSQRNEIHQQRKVIEKLQDNVKEKETEVNIFKAKYENSKTNETALSEQLSEMKRAEFLQSSTNKQEKENKDHNQLNASLSTENCSSSNSLTSKRSREDIDDNYDFVSKRRRKVTFSIDYVADTGNKFLQALKQEIFNLKMENKDLTNDLKREKISHLKTFRRLEAARKGV
ncbi:hypothetical protein CTEN210_00907 [Chaetoceros tenuissimus]|uniref:Uncharacterized protein n=1 Tax=Chaetoceros tenuissimus TaxID=426638 RepID=A0AAD3GZD9_9STRA|nr:hypothetical protein CTEN210_00907 [Chaetoceros tenuissimus]